MAIELTVYDRGTDYLASANLDPSKVLEDGSPDPAWNVQWAWDKDLKGLSEAEYIASIKAESLLLAQSELAKRQPAAQGAVV